MLRNFHRFLGSAEVVQALDTAIAAGKRTAPSSSSCPWSRSSRRWHRRADPRRAGEAFVVVEHDLPGRDQLEAIARGVATEPGELPEGDGLDAVLDAAAGLTRVEAENAFSLSLVRHGRLAPEVLWELKGRALEEVGPADAAPRRRDVRRPRRPGGPQGVLLPRPAARPAAPASAPAACSCWACRARASRAFAKALGHETGPADAGPRRRGAARLARRPDRGEHPPGAAAGRRDGPLRRHGRRGREGAGRRRLGPAGRLGRLGPAVRRRCSTGSTTTRATRSSSAPPTTSRRLPPEFARAERFDATFFLDLPGPRREGGDLADVPGAVRPRPGPAPAADRDWTGAEIRTCCRLAALLDVPLVEAAQNIVPVAVTAGESVERLRAWAAGRCLSADRPGLYTRRHRRRPGRKSGRDPSSN